MEKNLLLEKIMDTAWFIKQEHPRYGSYKSINMLARIFQDTIVYEDDDIKIDAFIYYSYLLYLGCLYE